MAPYPASYFITRRAVRMRSSANRETTKQAERIALQALRQGKSQFAAISSGIAFIDRINRMHGDAA